MAQTGFTPIVTYNTATATTVPSAANLAQGELAVNVTDKKLYTKDSGGNVVLLASNGGDVTGPATSTNLAIPTFSGTGGKTLLDNAGATISAGVITATGFNKMAITAPATSSTLAVADGKTLTANKTLTLDGTDSTTMTFPTTSATIARTDAAQTFTGIQTFSSTITSNLATGTAPLAVSSTTRVANLNVASAGNTDTLQTYSGSFYLPNLLINNRNVLDEKCYTSSGWNTWIIYGGGTTYSVAADGPTGLIQSCLEVNATGVAGWRSTDVTSATTVKNTSLRVMPTETYTISCKYRIVSGSLAKIIVDYYDVAGAFLSSTSSSSGTSATWADLTYSITVPASAAYMSVGIYAEVSVTHFGLWNMIKTV